MLATPVCISSEPGRNSKFGRIKTCPRRVIEVALRFEESILSLFKLVTRSRVGGLPMDFVPETAAFLAEQPRACKRSNAECLNVSLPAGIFVHQPACENDHIRRFPYNQSFCHSNSFHRKARS